MHPKTDKIVLLWHESTVGQACCASSNSSPFSPTGSTTRRGLTVEALYKRLNHYHFVLVRGTPASGKSTLAQLLDGHIRTKEPVADPILIGHWRRDAPNWVTRLTTKYDSNGPNIIITDEAQLNHWDDEFWNSFLKTATPKSSDRIILFASYGSPDGRVSVEGTPMFVPNCQQVSLRPVNHGDGIATAGLFLMADEFADMVAKLFPADRFKADFLDYVFRVTAGHTGAATDLLRVVLNDRDGGEYSLEIFQSQFPIGELWLRLQSTSIFRRGLPMLRELRQPGVARVLRAVLSNNHVTNAGL